MKTLIVEDHTPQREHAERLLRERLPQALPLATASDGVLALDRARKEKPELLLLDIQLPGISGFDVLAELRSWSDRTRLPVVAVTASVMDHDRRKILAAGFDAYVSKPVNIRELLETLNGLLATEADAP